MDELLDLLHPYLEHLARPYADPSRPAESTSDLLQESCLRAWQKIDSFEGGMNDEETFAMFRSWVGKLVKHLGLNAHRKRKRQRRSPPNKILPLGSPNPDETSSSGPGAKLDPKSPVGTPSEYARKDEQVLKIQEALQNLPDQEAAAIVRMRFFDGMTLIAISEKLGIGYEQVKDRYRSTMRQLERDLEGLL